jgi:hypothetical protein
MALWFLRGIRRGVVTTRYPAAVDAWARDLPTPPAFRSSLLTSALAERLVASCPFGALRRDGGDLVLDLGACTGCARCLEVAGDAGARLGRWELASTDRDALVKRVAIRGEAR